MIIIKNVSCDTFSADKLDPHQYVGPDLDPLGEFMDFLRKRENKPADKMNTCTIIQYTKS